MPVVTVFRVQGTHESITHCSPCFDNAKECDPSDLYSINPKKTSISHHGDTIVGMGMY
jgi:hypothetical protein